MCVQSEGDHTTVQQSAPTLYNWGEVLAGRLSRAGLTDCFTWVITAAGRLSATAELL